MLSRWVPFESKSPNLSLSLCGLSPVRSLNQAEFVWATLEEIKKAQQAVHSFCESRNSLDPSDGLYRTIDGKICVPGRNALRQIMCAIAHSGIGCHRRVEATRTAILSKFYRPELQNDVIDFCKKCLHCIGSLDVKVPRPLGEEIHLQERSQVLHYDFLFIKTTMLLRLLREFLSSKMIWATFSNSFLVVKRQLL